MNQNASKEEESQESEALYHGKAQGSSQEGSKDKAQEVWQEPAEGLSSAGAGLNRSAPTAYFKEGLNEEETTLADDQRRVKAVGI